MSYSLAVLGEGETTGGRDDPVAAAVCVYGLYDTLGEARTAVQGLLADCPETSAFVVDETMRWIPVRAPAPDAAEEDEELAAPSNDAPSENRYGSVCDLRRRTGTRGGAAEPVVVGGDSAGGGASVAPSFVDPAAAAVIIPDAARRQARLSQQEQLESLLRLPVGPPPTTQDAYAADRARYATLRAFERKLGVLETQSRSLGAASTDAILRLDRLHPDYRIKFRSNYEKELKKSGMDVSTLPFAEYLYEGETATVA